MSRLYSVLCKLSMIIISTSRIILRLDFVFMTAPDQLRTTICVIESGHELEGWCNSAPWSIRLESSL
jgi:hypothetical protein